MTNDGSLAGNAAQFDYDSQAGITNLLVSVRASELSPEQKNELRDLIFLYMNGGKDQSVRISLEQKVAGYGLTPVSTTKTAADTQEEPAPIKPFGSSRPSPSFAPSAAAQQASAAPVQEVKTPPPPAPEPVAESKPQPAPAPQPEPVPEPAPAPEPTPAPVEQGESEVASAAKTNVTDESNLARIREIKALVNEKVGNPVNLVDIDNAVGREYMAAMLEAMKKVNTGSSAVPEMRRLEAAYLMVEKTVAEKAEVSADVAPTPAPEPVPQPAPEPVAESKPQPAPAPQPEPVPEPDPVPEPTPAPAPEPAPAAPQQPESSPATPPSSPTWGSDTDATQTSPESSEAEQKQPEETVKAASLAETKTKLKTPEDLPEASDLETSSVSGDPLYTKEVDDGLEQLLSEWSIFKKSGLFGTGPKGRQHPLFIKVANLQIPLLLAGRFEGATQEIKQSITDYMNGWRYEQGIIYNQGENFEHYLRRVIRHILDLQKRNSQS